MARLISCALLSLFVVGCNSADLKSLLAPTAPPPALAPSSQPSSQPTTQPTAASKPTTLDVVAHDVQVIAAQTPQLVANSAAAASGNYLPLASQVLTLVSGLLGGGGVTAAVASKRSKFKGVERRTPRAPLAPPAVVGGAA